MPLFQAVAGEIVFADPRLVLHSQGAHSITSYNAKILKGSFRKMFTCRATPDLLHFFGKGNHRFLLKRTSPIR